MEELDTSIPIIPIPINRSIPVKKELPIKKEPHIKKEPKQPMRVTIKTK
jgi:hypothetical protein